MGYLYLLMFHKTVSNRPLLTKSTAILVADSENRSNQSLFGVQCSPTRLRCYCLTKTHNMSKFTSSPSKKEIQHDHFEMLLGLFNKSWQKFVIARIIVQKSIAKNITISIVILTIL